MSAGKHRWGDAVPFQYKTERTCLNGCGITKVTHHQNQGAQDYYWNEYWRGEDKIPGGARPTCIPVTSGLTTESSS